MGDSAQYVAFPIHTHLRPGKRPVVGPLGESLPWLGVRYHPSPCVNPTLPHARCQEHPCPRAHCGRISQRLRDSGVRTPDQSPRPRICIWNQTCPPPLPSSVHPEMRIDPSLRGWQGVPGGHGRDEASRLKGPDNQGDVTERYADFVSTQQALFPQKSLFRPGRNKTEYEVHAFPNGYQCRPASDVAGTPPGD